MRLFVATEIPESHRTSLARALEPLKPLVPGARWTPPGSWHVTLKFLGEVPEGQVDEVQEVLEDVAAKVSPFTTGLTAAGAFPSVRRPRVLWIGLSDEDHGFRNLGGRLERKFEKLGFPREQRPFRPHLTLARIRDAGSRGGVTRSESETAEDFVGELAGRDIDRSGFTIGEVVLFQSHLGAEGSRYEPKLRIPFD